MKYIGYSVSNCVRDIALGIIQEREVPYIIAGTRIRTKEDLDYVINAYTKTYWKDMENAPAICRMLWNKGKIKQVRLRGKRPFAQWQDKKNNYPWKVINDCEGSFAGKELETLMRNYIQKARENWEAIKATQARKNLQMKIEASKCTCPYLTKQGVICPAKQGGNDMNEITELFDKLIDAYEKSDEHYKHKMLNILKGIRNNRQNIAFDWVTYIDSAAVIESLENDHNCESYDYDEKSLSIIFSRYAMDENGYGVGTEYYTARFPIYNKRKVGCERGIINGIHEFDYCINPNDFKIIIKAPSERENKGYYKPDEDFVFQWIEPMLKEIFDSVPNIEFNKEKRAWVVGDSTFYLGI